MKTNPAIALILALAITACADTFSGRLLVYPQWTHAKTVGASTVTETFATFLDWTHTSGAGSNQMNTIVRETVTLTNSQARTVDLAAIPDSFGDSTTFTNVRFIAVSCPSANVDPIDIGAAGEDAFSAWAGDTNQTVRVRPGGIWLMVAPDAAGYAPGGGKLMLRNTGTNSASYSLYIGGSE